MTPKDLMKEKKRQILRDVTKDAEIWNLDDFANYVDDALDEGRAPTLCMHARMAIRLLDELDAERERSGVLLKRMDDLCEEMENIQPKDKIFVMGSGIDAAD